MPFRFRRSNRRWLTHPSTWIDVILLALVAAMLAVDVVMIVR